MMFIFDWIKRDQLKEDGSSNEVQRVTYHHPIFFLLSRATTQGHIQCLNSTTVS